MILHGRITVYGEYLIKTQTYGLVVPAQLYLATSDHADKPVHEAYDHSRDCVARFLKGRGFVTERQIHGDLPFGFGLASSTALAFLHTSRSHTLTEAISVVNDCDREMHGFVPSGFDSAAISRQVPGLFSTSEWKDVCLSPFLYTLVFPPAERTRTLVEIKGSMHAVIVRLSQLADSMSNRILVTGELDYPLLFEYSRILLKASVYSSVTGSLVERMLADGIAAKAIGGLYDKAILVVWPSVEAAERSMHLLDGYCCSPLSSG